MKRLTIVLSVMALLVVGAAPALSQGPENFRTHLTGDEEVTDTGPVDTRAQGQAIFKLSPDGDELHYKVIVANIENVLMAHIHIAPEGVNGPIAVWLHPPVPTAPEDLEPADVNGILAEGTITAEDLVGPLEGASMDDLMEEIRSGNAYVNVHTTQNPGGEVRGQID